MNTVFRWFGEKDDSVKLEHIRQIPGIKGLATSLYHIPVGEVWPLEEILHLKNNIESNGLEFKVIESVNIHEDIKLGKSNRELYIENYKETIRNLGKAGIKVICYNFMPIFDWLRTDLCKDLEDGSNTMAYDNSYLENITPEQLVKDMEKGSNGYSLPGWEPERLKELQGLFEQYRDISEEELLDNLVYFLNAIMPICQESDVKMAIHPDDPPWSLFELPRIITGKDSIMKMLNAVDSEYNGLTLCTGSLGANTDNNIPELIRLFGGIGRIHFAHVRNLKFTGNRQFHETSHLSTDGSFDMFEIMKALKDIGFKGYMRPDHGRMIWDEVGRPGYGLYDRALGVAYLNGLNEAINKMKGLNE